MGDFAIYLDSEGNQVTRGWLVIKSHHRIGLRFDFTFQSESGAQIHAQSVSYPVADPWTKHEWWQSWSVNERWTRLTRGFYVTVTPREWAPCARYLDLLAAFEETQPKPNIPIAKWRGRSYRANRQVPALCRNCGARGTIPPEVMNAVAETSGLIAQLFTAYNAYQEGRTYFDPNQQVKRIASNMSRRELESQRQNALAGAACSECGSVDLLLAMPG